MWREMMNRQRKFWEDFRTDSYLKKIWNLPGFYLYLCNLTGLYKDKDQAVRRLQSFYMQKEDSFLLFWILLQMAPESIGSTSRIVFMMEEQFERGCRSPFLYLEAWKYISRDMTLLHRMSGFWAQGLSAGRKKTDAYRRTGDALCLSDRL